MKLLALGRPRPGVDARAEITRHARDELRSLWTLYREGLVREMYSPGGPGIVLVLEADSVERADFALSALPLVANGIIEFELVELLPLSALQMLFSDGRGTQEVDP